MTALTTPAIAEEYSASNWFVMIWNSWIASRPVFACAPADPPRRSSLLLPPSIRNSTPLPSWPLIRRLAELGLADGTICTPGSRATNPVKLRVDEGRSRSSSSETLPPTCDDDRSTSGASPATVTVSSSAPMLMVTSIVVVTPTSSVTPSRTNRLKPASSAVRVYGPGRRFERK